MRAFRVSRRAALSVCAFLPIWTAIAHAQQSRPTVDVLFEITAEPFKTSLSKEQREKVEADLAEKLVQLSADSFAYLNWQAVRTIGPRTALKVVLRHQDAGYGNEIFLQYSSVSASREAILPRSDENTVYRAYALSLPTYKPEVLTGEVRNKLEAAFENQDFCRKLHQRLAKNVSITDTITFDAANQRCILPLSWESLQAADGSVLLAEFQARPPEETELRPVIIRMALEPWVNGLKYRIFEFRYPPTTALKVERAEQLSDPKISESLRDKVGQVAVYMEEYVRDYRVNTKGPLNVTP